MNPVIAALGLMFVICLGLPLASLVVDALLLRAVRKYIARHPEIARDVTQTRGGR